MKVKFELRVTQSCLTFCNPKDCSPWNSPGQNTGAGSLSLLQGVFPTQGSNPGLPHCRWIIYQLSHRESAYKPHILQLVNITFLQISFFFRNLFDKETIHFPFRVFHILDFADCIFVVLFNRFILLTMEGGI